MFVKNIKIENFKGLRNEFVEFDKSCTVLTGRNGGGKSSVLEAISIMLSWLPVKLCNYAVKGKKISDGEISYGANYAKLTMQIESKSPLTLTLYKQRNSNRNSHNSNMQGAFNFGRDMRVMIDGNAAVQIPVLAYYGAMRDTSGYCAPQPISSTDRTQVYKNAFAARTDFVKLDKWFAQMAQRREFEMQQAAKLPLKKGNALRAKIDAFYNPLSFVSKALAGFAPEFGTFEVRNGQTFLKSRNIPSSGLSDGEKTVIALIADIAMRAIVANPEMKNPLLSEGVILIDEIDLHLHPDWQARIAQKLPEIFPRAQFIFSSHSPSVMSVSKNLYKINSETNAVERVENTYGRSPADILTQLLNAHREPEVAKKLRAMYAAIDNNDMQAAQRIVDELNVIIPEDPEVLRGEYLIRALQ